MIEKTDNTTVSVASFDDLNTDQRAALASLAVSPEQSEFGGDFETSVGEIEAAPRDLRLGAVLLVDDKPMGLCLLKRPPFAPDWADHDAVTLHGLKIDHGAQGRGHGRVLMRRAIKLAHERWPLARRIQLMVDADNMAALGLYRSFGMDDSGPVYSGRIGQEHRLAADVNTFVATEEY